MNSNSILKADYLDILFEGRNKTYGGYELRTKYNRRVTIATLTTLLLVALLVVGKYIADARKPAPVIAEDKEDKEVEMVYQEPPPMQKDEPPPPPAAETPPPPVKPTVQFTPPVITDQPIREDERPATQEEMAETPPGPQTAAGDINGVDPGLNEPGPGTGGPIEPSEPDPMKIEPEVDRQATYPGLYAYLNKNLRYPDQDREEGHEGKVFVSFVVNLDGDIQDVKVSRSSGFPNLDAEALRVVRGMKGWTPAQKAGRNVRSVFKQPVTFRLSE